MNSTPLERDARLVNARDEGIHPGDIAIGVIIGRTSEFFDFFVYAIASVLVFPTVVFPYVDALTGTLYSFALFSLAFIGRPLGTLIFTAIDRRHGRGAKLTIAIFLLGGSTMAISLLPGHAQVGALSAWLLGLFRLLQGIALGGAWDGLPSLLSLNAPRGKRGWYAMIPQLGAPLGLVIASALFAYFLALLTGGFPQLGLALPVLRRPRHQHRRAVRAAAHRRDAGIPARLRVARAAALAAVPHARGGGRNIALGAFAPLASFALFHLVTVFPLSWVRLNTQAEPVRFLVLEAIGAGVCVLAIMASGFVADRVGRRAVLGVSAALIGAYSGFAPQLLGAGELGEALYMLGGFVLLGLSFGQSSGAVNSRFPPAHRYTGAAIVGNSAWFIGAGFAPLVALFLASRFGLWTVGLYLLSGVLCTLIALAINRDWAARENSTPSS